MSANASREETSKVNSNVDPSSTSSAVEKTPTKSAKQTSHIIFDLDNTLYPFHSTGIDTDMHRNIQDYIVSHLHLEPQAAGELATKYYKEYGLTICGLMDCHNVDPKHYCEYVHNIGIENKLTKDPQLYQVLHQLEDTNHNLWVMTNADTTHAERVLSALGCEEKFRCPESGKLKIIDCFQQWNHSSPVAHSKPKPKAYECAIQTIGISEEGDRVIMVEDSIDNLGVPKELGWITVWVSHGRPVPKNFPHTVIESIYELHDALEKLSIVETPK